MDNLDLFTLNTDRSTDPLILPWLGSSSPIEPHTFSDLSVWRNFIENLSLTCQLPQFVAEKFARAQRLYFLGWIDQNMIKAGELVAFVTLELALRDSYPLVYQQKDKKGNLKSAGLKDGLKYMVEVDGLTDDKMPSYQKYGWPCVANLYKDKRKDSRMTLVWVRNSLAHGDPFDSLPWSGLLEIVRDLIDYMYRTDRRV